MRPRYTVLVEDGHGEMVAVGTFKEHDGALAYADTLPVGDVLGVARISTTDMWRVETGHSVVAGRRLVAG